MLVKSNTFLRSLPGIAACFSLCLNDWWLSLGKVDFALTFGFLSL